MIISPTPYPFNISIFLSTPPIYNLTYPRVIYCLQLISRLEALYIKKHSISRIYCPIYHLFIKIQSRRHSLNTLHSKNDHILERGRRKLVVLSLHHRLQRLVLELKKLPGGRRTLCINYIFNYLLTWSQSTLMESYLEDTLSWLSYPDFTPKKTLLLDQNLLSNQLQLMAWPLHLHAPSTNCP